MMKKLLVVLLLTVTVCLLFTSCAEKDKTPEPAQDDKTPAVEPDPVTPDPLYTREGDYIWFGSYPQSEVTDEALKTALNEKAGALPTAANAQAWTSYGYYSAGVVFDYMWYIDVTNDGDTYRGVYFNKYRSYYTGYTAGTDGGNGYQKANGYKIGKVYWFKFEPLKWRILSEKSGNALILCENLIDSQAYQNDFKSDSVTGHFYNTTEGVPSGTYANNYEYSSIRKWLNEVFYKTAFNELQQGIINTVTVDNSERSTNPDRHPTYWNDGVNPYACADTRDKVFLLSESEATNRSYGFNSDPEANSTDAATRQKKATDYAKAQGIYTESGGEYDGNGWWWLRSPICYRSIYAHGGIDEGDADSGSRVGNTRYGVLPALQIRLD